MKNNRPIVSEICPALVYQSNFYALDSDYFKKHKMAFLTAIIKNRINKVDYAKPKATLTLPQSLFTKKLSKKERTITQKVETKFPIRYRLQCLNPYDGLEEAVRIIKRKFPKEIFYFFNMYTQSYAKKPLIDNPILGWKLHPAYQIFDEKTGKIKNSKEEVLKLDTINGKKWLTQPYKKRVQLVGEFADEECKFFGYLNENLTFTMACPTQKF